MIHWTRQIKEVLSAQESVETGENLGPLEEIEFWHNRCMDLSSISKQLVKKGVKHIESILFLAKSSYLTPFRKLAQQIQVEWSSPGLSTLGQRLGRGRRRRQAGRQLITQCTDWPGTVGLERTRVMREGPQGA